jgi:hypothetical protein
MDEIKNVSARYEDDLVQLRKKCIQLQQDLKAKHAECNALQKDIDYKEDLIQKHEFDMQKEMEIVVHLNNEVLIETNSTDIHKQIYIFGCLDLHKCD